MQKFKNIIFDLGGIFIDIDYSKTKNAFEKAGIYHFDELFTQHHASSLFEDLECGSISPEVFYDRFRAEVKTTMSNADIEQAWNAMLLTFAPEKLEWLQKIKSGYNIYLFSNTNAIHYKCFQQIFQEATGLPSFDEYFIRAYYSHSLGMRKPYPASFSAILANENLKASETLFIDDTINNIEGAKQVGMQTLLLQAPKTVLDIQL